MKNRNFRIVTIILACLLLIGAMVGIAVSANDGASVSIDHKNVSYDGALQIVYAIKSEGLTDGQTVKIYFYDSQDAETPSAKKGMSEHKKELNGIVYDVAFSEGIAPKDVRKTVYARPVIENADGNVAVLGEMVEYSVWQYAVNRFSKAPTSEQLALYTALLDYCADVQAVLLASGDYKDEELEACGGYADEYYVLDLNSVVDGESVAVSRATYNKAETTSATFEIEAAKKVGGAYFNGFTDSLGNALYEYGAENTASTWNKLTYDALVPGVNAINLNYASDEYATSFDADENAYLFSDKYIDLSENIINMLPGSDEAKTGTATLTIDKNGNPAETLVANKGYAIVTALDGDRVIEFSKSIRVIEDTKYPDGYEGDTSGAYKAGDYYGNEASLSSTQINFMNKNQYTLSQKNDVTLKHVFETDLKMHSYVSTTVMQLYLYSKDGVMWALNLHIDGSQTLTLSVNGGADNGKSLNVSVPANEWHNLRFELIPDMITSEFELRVYLDGKFTGQVWTNYNKADAVTTGKDGFLERVGAFYLGAAKGCTTYFKNTYLTTVLDEADHFGEGEYFNNPNTNKDGAKLSNYSIGASLNPQTYTEENGNKALRFTRYAEDPSTTASGSFTIKTNVYGKGKYVFEADIKWLETAGAHYTWGGRIGLRSTASSKLVNDPSYLDTMKWQTNKGLGMVLNNSSPNTMQTYYGYQHIDPGKWHNIRIEYTPTGYDAETGNYTGFSEMFLNNILIRTVETSNTTNNLDLLDFSLWFRGYYNLDVLFDNIFVGIVDTPVHTFDGTALPLGWSASTSETLGAESLVANPLHTDAETAADRVLKVEMTEYSESVTRDTHAISLMNKLSAENTGVYEFSFDVYYENYTLPASTRKLQTIIFNSAADYLNLIDVEITSEGKLNFRSTTGAASGTHGGVGNGKSAVLALGVTVDFTKFTNVKFIIYKTGECATSEIELIVDGVSYGRKVAYHNAYTPTAGGIIDSATVRLHNNPVTTALEDGSTVTENKYNVYFDNVTLAYLGEIEE